MDILSRPKLGAAVWPLKDVPLNELARLLQKMKFDGLVLSFDQVEQASDLQEILALHQLTCFAIKPGEIDLAHPDTAVRRQAIAHVERAIDAAASFQVKLVTVREQTGRFRPIAAADIEREHFESAICQLADFAQARGVDLALDVVNRYEGYLLTKTAVALDTLRRAENANLRLTLNAFHLNIEEADVAAAIKAVGNNLALYYLADSNRQAVGQGHLKLGLHLWALESLPEVPIILDCLPAGGDPFGRGIGEDGRALILEYLQVSRSWF